MFNANDLRINDARCHEYHRAADRQRTAHAAQALRQPTRARAFAWFHRARLAAHQSAPIPRPVHEPGRSGAPIRQLP